jgi:hypothetical protein
MLLRFRGTAAHADPLASLLPLPHLLRPPTALSCPCRCREVQLLCHLKHENIVGLRDILPPLDPASFRDVYLVYELMDTDLHQIIASPQQLSEDHVSYFVYQVGGALCCVRFALCVGVGVGVGVCLTLHLQAGLHLGVCPGRQQTKSRSNGHQLPDRDRVGAGS